MSTHNHNHNPGFSGRLEDRWGLGAAGWPQPALSDYRPIPVDETGSTFLPDRLAKGYHREEIGDGVHYVTTGAYDAMFVQTDAGVVVVDNPPTLAENMKAAIAEVTDEPVTHFIYSHWHADHVGAVGVFGEDVTYVAQRQTRELLERWPDIGGPRGMRLPTELFEDHETLNVGGVEIELNYHGVNHSVGNSFIYLPKQKVLAAIDIFSPGWTAFRHCDASENIRGWTEAHDWILEYDFNAVVCGHTNHWGTRADAQESRDYVFDMVEFSKEALNSTVDQELFERFGLANAWVLWDAYFNELSNEVTYKTLNKVTDNGQTWAQRLAGADVMTKYHAYSILEALRLEWGLLTGFEQRVSPQPEGAAA